MMKRYLLYLLLGLAALPLYGQGVTDYYRLPDRSHQYNRLLARYGGPAIQDRWYLSLDGFVRTDRARLDDSFGGLIESNRVTKPGWGAVVGWAYREKWAVEAGYARMPIHTQLSVRDIGSPRIFRYTTAKNVFILRGKRLVASTSGPWLRSGFWLSGGMWIMPNNGQQEANFSLTGRYAGRWESPDPFRLTSRTQSANQATALAEVAAEYNVRLSNSVDLGLSVRKYWGLANALTTDLTYMTNRTAVQQAHLQGAGTGMSYGVTLRYSFAIRRTVSDVLELRGNGRIR